MKKLILFFIAFSVLQYITLQLMDRVVLIPKEDIIKVEKDGIWIKEDNFYGKCFYPADVVKEWEEIIK